MRLMNEFQGWLLIAIVAIIAEMQIMAFVALAAGLISLLFKN